MNAAERQLNRERWAVASLPYPTTVYSGPYTAVRGGAMKQAKISQYRAIDSAMLRASELASRQGP